MRQSPAAGLVLWALVAALVGCPVSSASDADVSRRGSGAGGSRKRQESSGRRCFEGSGGAGSAGSGTSIAAAATVIRRAHRGVAAQPSTGRGRRRDRRVRHRGGGAGGVGGSVATGVLHRLVMHAGAEYDMHMAAGI